MQFSNPRLFVGSAQKPNRVSGVDSLYWNRANGIRCSRCKYLSSFCLIKDFEGLMCPSKDIKYNETVRLSVQDFTAGTIAGAAQLIVGHPFGKTLV